MSLPYTCTLGGIGATFLAAISRVESILTILRSAIQDTTAISRQPTKACMRLLASRRHPHIARQ